VLISIFYPSTQSGQDHHTQNAAHTVIHSLREILAAFLHSDLYQRWLKLVLLRFDGSFWTLAREARRRGRIVQKTAGGSEADLRAGEEKLPTAQAGTGHAGDAPGNRGRSQSRPTGLRLLGSVEHRHNSAGQFDHPTCKSRSGSSHLGHSTAVPTPAGSLGMVAR